MIGAIFQFDGGQVDAKVPERGGYPVRFPVDGSGREEPGQLDNFSRTALTHDNVMGMHTPTILIQQDGPESGPGFILLAIPILVYFPLTTLTK